MQGTVQFVESEAAWSMPLFVRRNHTAKPDIVAPNSRPEVEAIGAAEEVPVREVQGPATRHSALTGRARNTDQDGPIVVDCGSARCLDFIQLVADCAIIRADSCPSAETLPAEAKQSGSRGPGNRTAFEPGRPRTEAAKTMTARRCCGNRIGLWYRKVPRPDRYSGANSFW